MKSLQNLSYKTLFTILFLSLAGIVFFLKIGGKTQKVSAAWWDEMWHYRKAISISNTSGSDLTDFQVSVSIGTSQLIADGKMQTDCDDLRITDINGNLLPYWIEENNPGCNQLTDTKIWLKASSLPTSGSIVYLYYGNSSANNNENGRNVFLEFDDFNNPSTLNNWTLESNPTTTYSISGGTMSAIATSGDYSSTVIGTNYTDVVVNSRFSVNTAQSHGGFIFRSQSNAADNSYQWLIREGLNDNRVQKRLGGGQTHLLGGTGGIALPSTLTAGNWYPVEIRLSGTQVDTYFNNQQSINGSLADTGFASGKVGILSYDGNEYFDYFFVRKYASTQPTSTPQSEELGTGPIAYWKFDDIYNGYTALEYITINNDLTNGYLNSINTNTSYNNATKLEFTVKSSDVSGYIALVSGYSSSTTRAYPCILGSTSYIAPSSFTTSTLTPSNITRPQFSDGTTRTFNLDFTSSSNYPISFGSWQDSSWSRTVNWYSFKIWNGNTMVKNFIPTKRNSDNALGFYDTINSTFYTNTGTGSFTAGPEITYDSSGLSNGTITNTAYASEDQCISGKCLYFNGSAYVNTNFGANRDISTKPLSVSMWVKPTQSGNYMFLSPNQGTNQRFYFATYNGKWDMGVYSSSWGSGTIPVELNKWAHIDIVANGSTVYMYVNGKITRQINYSSFTFPESIYIGQHGTSGNYRFYGYIDDVKFYNYARTADQIKLDYNSRGSLSGAGINLGAHSNTVPSLKSSLVAHWKFDEGNSVTVKNQVNNNYTLTSFGQIHPTVENNGKINKSLYFHGIGSTNRSYMYTTPINIGNSGTLSFSFWVNPDSSQSGDGTIIRNGVGMDQNYKILIGSPSSNKYKIFIQRYNGTWESTSTNNYLLSSSEWSHVSIVLTESLSWKFYLNGKYIETISIGGTVPNSTSYLAIGGHGGTSSQYLNGYLDEIKIYNRALTDEEIKQDYNAGSAIQFGSTSQSIGGTTTSLEYCIPGDTSYCVPPIAEWKMDEGVGTSITDTSGNSNTGTITGATWNQGKIGKGLKFNGSNNYVEVPSTPNTTGTFTISTWVKAINGSSSDGYGYIIHRGSDYSIGGSVYFLGINPAGNYVGAVNGNYSNGDTGIAANENIWRFLTLSYDGNTQKVYVDGQLKSSYSLGAITNTTTGNKIGFGGTSLYLNYRNIKGQMDQVRVYDYARTPAQIAYDYNKGAPVAWYKFDECQGNTAYDWSGNQNNGTITVGASGSQNSLGTCAIGTSAAWTNGASGKINSSLNFDGTDDYISIPDSPSLTTPEITIAAWVKSNNNGDPYQRIVDKTYNQEYAFFLGSTGTIGVSLVTNTSSIDSSLLPNAITDTNWHHIAFSWSAATKKVTVYVDGVAKTNTTLNGDRIADSNNPLIIGDRVGLDRSFNGQLDDVRIYNYALTNEQVKQIYNGGAVNFR